MPAMLALLPLLLLCLRLLRAEPPACEYRPGGSGGPCQSGRRRGRGWGWGGHCAGTPGSVPPLSSSLPFFLSPFPHSFRSLCPPPPPRLSGMSPLGAALPSPGAMGTPLPTPSLGRCVTGTP